MIPVYAYLVKYGWLLEPTGTENEKVIPEPYRRSVAEHLATRLT
nr:CD1375 family protein [Brevibacillus sp. HB1.3]